MLNQIIIVAAIIVLFWLLRKLFPSQPKPHLDGHSGHEAADSKASPYQAVSVHCYEGACDRAKKLQGERYLTAEAPVIPLSTCTASRCHCVYRHHEDRRSGEKDRRKLHDLSGATPATSDMDDRRHGSGRRATDLVAA